MWRQSQKPVECRAGVVEGVTYRPSSFNQDEYFYVLVRGEDGNRFEGYARRDTLFYNASILPGDDVEVCGQIRDKHYPGVDEALDNVKISEFSR